MEETRIPEETGIPINGIDDSNPERAGWIKWVPPLLLLLLVPVLVGIAVFSRQPPTLWSATDIALFILTALLCTLVAVSLTLAGCSDWLRRMDQSSQAMVAQILALQDTQTRLGEVVHKSNQEVGTRISQQEGQQRLAYDGVALLTGSVQTIASNLAALSQALQAQKEATATTLATVSGGHGQLVTDVQKLHTLIETQAETARQTSAAVTAVAGGQTALQDMAKHALEELTGLETKHSALADAFQNHEQASHTALAALTASHADLTGGLQQLRELTQTVTGAVTGVAQEQATAHGSLRETLTAATDSIRQSQQTLQTELGTLAETTRQTHGTVTALAANQTALQDATQRIVEELRGLGARQVALGDALRGHEQAGNTAVSALTGGLQQVRELAQTVAGAVTGAAQDQAAAHGLLREALTATTDSIRQSQQTLQTEVGTLAETTRQTSEVVTALAGGQTAVYAATQRIVEELTSLGARQVALGDALRGQEQTSNAAVSALTGGLQQLRELTQAVAGAVAGTTQDQAAAHNSLRDALTVATAALQEGQKTLQAQGEKVAEVDRQMLAAVTALTAGQGQLANDLRQLQELARSAAGSISEVAREQTAAHGTLQGSTQLLIAAAGALQQGQKNLQAQAEKVTETDGQMVAAVTALTAGQGQLANDLRQLQELSRSAAGGIRDVAREQTTAHGALQDRTQLIVAVTEAVQRDQQALQAQIEKVAETARQTIAAVSAVAAEQTTGREAVRRMVGQAANAALAALALGQGSLTGVEPRLQVLAQTVASSGLLDAAPSELIEKAGSPLRLAAAQAVIHGEQMRYEAGPNRDNLGHWANPRDRAQWEFDVPQPGRFTLAAEIAALGPGRFQVLVGHEELAGTAPTTGDYGRFQTVELGVVELAAGKTSLAVRPIPEGWQPMNLRSLDLTPVP